MRRISFFGIAVVLLALCGCANLGCKLDVKAALQGTDTAIVGLYIDDKGFPQPTVGRVNVYPGQKILFAGPNTFDIFFKDKVSPIGDLVVQSSNGVVIIEIPMDIFEREQRKSKMVDTKGELVYRYGIRANGKVTDPEIGVRPR